MSTPAARPGPVRWISVGTFAVWLFLFGATYGYLPFLSHAWGTNLLRYLPDWVAWSLTVLALLVSTDEARRGLIATGRAAAGAFGRLPERMRDGLLLAAALVFFWLCRDRVLLGDAQVLALFAGHAPGEGEIVPAGVSLLFLLHRSALALGLPAVPGAQLVACALAAVSLLFVAKAARFAAPDGRGAAAIPLLVFSGGVAAALAGRFETQVFAVAPVSVHLWLCLRFLAQHERRGLRGAAIALGLAIAVQPSCLVLLPALLQLPRLTRGDRDAPAGRSAGGNLLLLLGLALGPLLAYAAVLLAAAPDSIPAGAVVARVLVGSDALVRFSGETVGTDYVLLGVPHLKYLANAAFVLAPAALSLLIVLLVRDRSRAFASTPVRFLGLSTVLLALPVIAVRPVWGPFDWDLFCVPAVFAGCLAGAALASVDDAGRRAHLLTAAVGLQLVFVGIPMLAVIHGSSRSPGPFGPKRFEPLLYQTQTPPPERIAPWL